jgi:hypothetical protein
MRSGRALCIGVDTTSSGEALAEADACALAEIASEQGFELSTLLLGSAATRSQVSHQLRVAAADCRPGDLFLLTFSGHGGRRHCVDDAGRGGLRGAWVLFDGSIDDADMHAALARFRVGVRVLVISDSCNGGVPGDGHIEPLMNVSASVLVLSACRQDKHADAPGMPGNFTSALLRAWRGGRRIADYRAFYDSIASGMPEYQQPSYYWVGTRDPRFEAQAPFTV